MKIPQENLEMLLSCGWEQVSEFVFANERRGTNGLHYVEAMDLEVRDLMKQWLEDPSWELEPTPGFDGFRGDLGEFQDLVHEREALKEALTEKAEEASDLRAKLYKAERDMVLLSKADAKLNEEIATKHPLDQMNKSRRKALNFYLGTEKLSQEEST